MKTVHKSVLIWYSAAEMFDLVTDVARYPEFLPWCNQALVLAQDEAGMTAKIGIALAGLKQSFTTRNQHEKNRRVTLELVDGPFSKLNGHWDFQSLDSLDHGAQRACQVELTLRYDFDNFALAALVGPVFDKIAGSLVDAFVKRAAQVYGES
jgi:ribosome-associated toxin RatA of RatAB toxin-antitoxin module